MLSVYSSICLFGILTCFISSTAGRVAIIGGQRAEHHHSFPYQVALIVRGNNDCGGGIIADQFILSAAHCTLDADGHFFNDPVTVVAGTNNLLHTVPPAVIGHVHTIYVPEQFNARIANSRADIAVLRLRQPLDLHRHQNLRVLDLPHNQRETYVGRTAIIAGFGWDVISMVDGQEHGYSSDDHLRYAEVDVIDRTSPHYYPHINPAVQMCARVRQHKHDRRGTCTGDSGSPLVLGNIAIGILSVSPSNCEEDVSGAVYTRVSSYVNFIQNAIHGNTHGMRTHTLL